MEEELDYEDEPTPVDERLNVIHTLVTRSIHNETLRNINTLLKIAASNGELQLADTELRMEVYNLKKRIVELEGQLEGQLEGKQTPC